MTFIAEATVPTDNAAKYAAQLGKHWSHKLTVSEHGEAVHVTFPKGARGADWPADALVVLAPQAGALVCRIEASADGQREALKGAVERHVDRFAFREAPLQYDWNDNET